MIKLYIWDMAVQFTDKLYMEYGRTIYRQNNIFGIWPDNLQIQLYIWPMVGQFSGKTIYMGYGSTIYRLTIYMGYGRTIYR